MNALSFAEINAVSGAGEYADAAAATLAGMGIVGSIGGGVAVSSAYTAAGGTITNAALIESVTLGGAVAAAPIAAFGAGWIVGSAINDVYEWAFDDTIGGDIYDLFHDDSPTSGSGTVVYENGDSVTFDYIFRG